MAATGDLLSRDCRTQRNDLLGVGLSVGCAAHCAAVPLLIGIGPLVRGLGWMADPWFHQAMAVACCGVIARSLVPTLRRRFDPLVAGLAGFGVALLTVAAFVLPDPCCDWAAGTGWIGRPLLSPAAGDAIFGEPLFRGLSLVQPFLTPLGAALLAAAHLMNLERFGVTGER